jgi:hypothetical protein
MSRAAKARHADAIALVAKARDTATDCGARIILAHVDDAVKALEP